MLKKLQGASMGKTKSLRSFFGLRNVARSVLNEHLPTNVVTLGDVVFEIWGPKPELSVGRRSYGYVRIYSWCKGGKVEIGNYVAINTLTVMIGGEHHLDVTTFPFKSKLGAGIEKSETKGGVKIGNDVWIGKDVIVMDGAHIGDGAIIGVRSLVTADIPPYAIAVGSPAAPKNYRFSKEEIKMLLDLEWWALPEEYLLGNIEVLYQRDVAKLAALVNDYHKKFPTAKAFDGGRVID
jgi:acetyltransferase-like isoleucine patch superfamily enzyme